MKLDFFIQPTSEFGDARLMFWVVRQVLKFVRIIFGGHKVRGRLFLPPIGCSASDRFVGCDQRTVGPFLAVGFV